MTDDSKEVEQRLIYGIHGTPELKHEEKMRYLGEFRERVLRVLTKKQVADSRIYPEIEVALRDPRSTFLLLDGDIPYSSRDKYIKLARKHQKPYSMVNDPKQIGDIGLAVVADHAIDVEKIEVN